jgi:hypothetical protein
MKNIIIAGILLLVLGCNRGSADGIITVEVREVEQVNNYTYLLVKGKGPEYWIAVPSMEARPGETYSYQGGLLMEDFYSEDLERTFDKVLFVEALFSGSVPTDPGQPLDVDYEAMVTIEKADVEVEVTEGITTIAEIYTNPEAYEGKILQVRGEVTKYNPSIMERNWIHIQDGSEHEGKFDLTVTSLESFQKGSVVTLEGTLVLNKDFGYGYTYEILLENATAVN